MSSDDLKKLNKNKKLIKKLARKYDGMCSRANPQGLDCFGGSHSILGLMVGRRKTDSELFNQHSSPQKH